MTTTLFTLLGLPAPTVNSGQPDLGRGSASATARMHGMSAAGMVPTGYDPVSGQNFLYIDPGARINGRGSDMGMNPADLAMQRGIAAGSSFLNSFGEGLVEGIGLPGKASFNYRMDMDGRMSGEGDALLSVYETDFTTLFVQAGIRSMWDERWVGNIGLGHRMIFSEKLMMGYNLFYDYDLGRDHERGGLGAEVWYDFMRISANYYAPISDWKDSKDLDWHKERPAEGWDARVKGYLPFYRNVALTGSYTQWYGDKVGVFGSSKLEKDPRVWSYGVEYTPIPLVSAFVSQKQTEKNHTDTEVGLTLTYHFQMPWEDQVKPSKVAELRTVAGARHDFVDRENKIILEYKEKGLRAAFGQFHWDEATVTMPLVIRSGSPITSVQWQGSAAQYLTSQNSSQGVVTLPGNGIYSIEAIVFNASGQRASTGVRYLYRSSTHGLQLVSDQTDTMVNVPLTLKYQVTDSSGQALYGKSVNFSVTSGSGSVSPVSAETAKDGTVTTTLTPTATGIVTVEAECEGVIESTDINVYALRGGLIATPDSLKENRETQLLFTLLATDGSPVAGEAISWSVAQGGSYAAITNAQATTDANGQAIATLRGRLANPDRVDQNVTVRVEVPGRGSTATVTAPVKVQALRYDLKADPERVIATVMYPVQFILTDDGEPVVNRSVTLTALSQGPDIGLSDGTATTDGSGRVYLTTSAPQNTADYGVSIQASLDNKTPSTSITVERVIKDAILVPEASSVGEGEPVKVNLLARSLLTGTAVANAPIQWTVASPGQLVSGDARTSPSGEAVATVTSSTAANIQVQAIVTAAGGDISADTELEFKGYQITLTAADSTIKEHESTTLTAVVSRSDGARMAGERINWTITGSAATLSAQSSTTDESGEATVTLQGKAEGGGAVAVRAEAPSLAVDDTENVTLTATSFTLTADPQLLVKYIEQPVQFTLKENGAPVVLRQADITLTGIGAVSGMPATITTDINGQFRPDLTGTGSGTVTVRASIDGKMPTTNLTVAESNYSASLTSSEVQVQTGDTVTFDFLARRRVNGDTQPIGNQMIYWHVDEGAGTILSASRMTDGLGHGAALVRADAPGRLVLHAELTENQDVAASAEVLVLGDGYSLTFDQDNYIGTFSGNKATVNNVVVSLRDAANRPVKDARIRFTGTVDDSANEGIAPNRRGKFYGFTVSKTGGTTITGGETYPQDTATTDANGKVTLSFSDVLGERTIRLEAQYTVSSEVTVVDTAYVKFGKGPMGGFRYPGGPGTWVTAANACGGYSYLNPEKHQWTEEIFGAPLPQYVSNSNLPRAEDLLAFMKNNKEAVTAAGWPTGYSYWTGTARRRTDNALVVSPTNPREEDISGPYNWLYWVCIR